MFNVINVMLASDHVHRKLKFTWLSLVMSLVVSYFVLTFSHDMSWIRSGTELGQFLRIVLPTFEHPLY